MPNIKSAKKRVKVTAKKNLRNRMVKSGVHTSLKKFEAAVVADPKNANVQLNATTSAIDKAVAKGVVHKNAANRKKARLAKQLNKAVASV
ncbi:MAG: 30S ribosomal protein S20 [Clostridia bacterium]|nr:30S ribosomal protein S20 [Clostridia bacterium]